ncbi:flagellar basal-body rod protein FlgB [Terriglobus roseus DSM 18391]|uniref:Flagellar basal body rod protein FlgB n=1 Tax=Terriglobus roseus (strain DSM 18391 / NRRL B-41598 / KBS 63) TaxID=926566 RepID=I3ZFU8_TERRK|nr:flagellar basal body rod protein FlgB [Terriglobus roseus]AFL88116.1 flagellar basal-body rod protein FlgB [Terriglobus roseus DSM 18391]
MLEMPTAAAIERYLSLSTQQMKLTAANIANIDTPGYKTVGIDFEAEFSKALESHNTDKPAEATVATVPGLTSRPDGNNVSVDRESMTMAATQLQFRTGIELLRHQYSQMMDAIKSDMK